MILPMLSRMTGYHTFFPTIRPQSHLTYPSSSYSEAKLDLNQLGKSVQSYYLQGLAP